MWGRNPGLTGSCQEGLDSSLAGRWEENLPLPGVLFLPLLLYFPKRWAFLALHLCRWSLNCQPGGRVGPPQHLRLSWTRHPIFQRCFHFEKSILNDLSLFTTEVSPPCTTPASLQGCAISTPSFILALVLELHKKVNFFILYWV